MNMINTNTRFTMCFDALFTAVYNTKVCLCRWCGLDTGHNAHFCDSSCYFEWQENEYTKGWREEEAYWQKKWEEDQADMYCDHCGTCHEGPAPDACAYMLV